MFHFGFGLMFLNFVGMILFVIVIVMAIKFLVRGARGYGRGPGFMGEGRPWRHDGPGPRAFDGPCGPWRHGRHDASRPEGDGHDDRRHDERGGRADQALDVLRGRLAGGEIGVDEFNALRSALEG